LSTFFIPRRILVATLVDFAEGRGDLLLNFLLCFSPIGPGDVLLLSPNCPGDLLLLVAGVLTLRGDFPLSLSPNWPSDRPLSLSPNWPGDRPLSLSPNLPGDRLVPLYPVGPGEMLRLLDGWDPCGCDFGSFFDFFALFLDSVFELFELFIDFEDSCGFDIPPVDNLLEMFWLLGLLLVVVMGSSIISGLSAPAL